MMRLVYLPEARIEILEAVIHQKRKPGYWEERKNG